MNEQEKNNLDSYQRAQARVDEIKGFYIHLICYLLVNPFLIYVNYVTYWDFKWFWFALGGWGIGLATHALTVFGFGKSWEQRKIKKLMDDERNF